MARIPMTNGFTVIPEGIYTFRIDDVSYDETWGKLEIKMSTSKGLKHTERYMLKDNNDEPNEKALNAFSYFAKTAMNNFEMEDVDPMDMIGHYIQAEVTHDVVPSTRNPNKTMTFVHLGDKAPADGFEDAPETAQTEDNYDVDSLLG